MEHSVDDNEAIPMKFDSRTIHPVRRRLFAVVLVAAGVLAACGGSGDTPGAIEDPASGDQPALTAPDGEERAAEGAPASDERAGEAPAGEEPPAEQPRAEEPAAQEPAAQEPPAEQPPAEQPPAEEPPAEDDATGEGLTGEEWAVVILLGVVVLAIVIGATALTSRRSTSRNQTRTTNQRRLDDITRASRSIHDSAVLSVLQTSDPARLQAMWGAGRAQLLDLESRIASLTPLLSEDSQQRTLHELGQAVAGVRGALESNVGLRLDPEGAGQAELIAASNRTVLYRSEQLEAALQQALYLTV
jgi:hypothetical protein